MPRALATLPSTLIAISTLVLMAAPPGLARAERAIDLGYPRSSEAFFKQGTQQLELEIKRLQAPRPATPLLTISPTVGPQMPTELQHLEQREQRPQPAKSAPPVAPVPHR